MSWWGGLWSLRSLYGSWAHVFFQKSGRWKGDFLQDTTKTEVSYVYRKPNGAGLQVECGKLVVLMFSWCPLGIIALGAVG